MVPPFSARLSGGTRSVLCGPSASVSVYLNTSFAVPVPLAYGARCACVLPSCRPMDGVPSAVTTVTDSLKVSCTSTVSPGVQAPSVPASLSVGAPTMTGAAN